MNKYESCCSKVRQFHTSYDLFIGLCCIFSSSAAHLIYVIDVYLQFRSDRFFACISDYIDMNLCAERNDSDFIRCYFKLVFGNFKIFT